MPGLGTLINVGAIIAGGLIGLIFGSFLKQRIQETLMQACALGTLFLGIGGALSKMLVISNGSLTTKDSMMMILSLVIGGLIGELLNIEALFGRLGDFLKEKSGNAKDPDFTSAFVNASLVVCIGAMAIVGSIQDGIAHNPDTLIAKSVLDFTIIIVMTATMGKGCLFSFVSVGLLQGSITLLASLLAPLMTKAALNNISFVGSILIFCVGINLLSDRHIRVANFLPSLIVAIIFSLF